MSRPAARTGLALATLVIAFLVAVILSDPIQRGRATVAQQMAAIQARVDEREPARPVLHGEAVPGEAWTSYEAAVYRLMHAPAGEGAIDVEEITAVADATCDEERARRHAWVDRFDEALAHLRHGATAPCARLERDWDRHSRLPHIFAIQPLTHLAVASSLLDIEEAGRPEEGIRDLLDGLQFLRDLAATGETIGVLESHRLLREGPLVEYLARRGLGGLDAPALDLLETGLARLELAWPRDLPSLEISELENAHHLLRAEGTDWASEISVWRRGPLRTLSFLHGIERRFELLEEARAALDAPGADRVAILNRFQARLRAGSSPFTRQGTSGLAYAAETEDVVVWIRALRALIAHARGHDPADMLEVHGRRIAIEPDASGLLARFTRRRAVECTLELAVDR